MPAHGNQRRAPGAVASAPAAAGRGVTRVAASRSGAGCDGGASAGAAARSPLPPREVGNAMVEATAGSRPVRLIGALPATSSSASRKAATSAKRSRGSLASARSTSGCQCASAGGSCGTGSNTWA